MTTELLEKYQWIPLSWILNLVYTILTDYCIDSDIIDDRLLHCPTANFFLNYRTV